MFKLKTDKEMILELQRRNKALNAENIDLKSKVEANLKATRKMVRVDDLTPEELIDIINIYQTWENGLDVKVDEMYKYNGELFKVIQAHTTQSDWQPDIVPALFNKIQPPSVIPEWVQPTGAHDAYNTGDKVIYNEVVRESVIDANTTVPDGDEPYNRYWVVV